MARTSLTLTGITRDGVDDGTPEAADTVNGNYVSNDGSVFLEVTNANAAAQSFDVQPKGLVDGQSVTPRSESVPGSSTRKFGAYPVPDYGDTLKIDTSSADLSFAAYHL